MIRQYLNRDFFADGEQIMADLYVVHREVNMHTHEFWEMSYVCEGKGTHYLEDDIKTDIREGGFVILSPGASHCLTSPPSDKGDWVRVCNILMTDEYARGLKNRFYSLTECKNSAFRKLLETDEPFCIQLKDTSDGAYNLFMTVANEHRHKSDISGTIMDSTALNIFIYAARLYEKSLSGMTEDNIKSDVIDDAIKYIRSNYGRNITLDYLAAYVHLAPAYLSRHFKKNTGKTISDFLAQTRIDRAKQMLRETDYTIGYISDYCGYKTLSNFQRAFKLIAGMTASEYRENNKR